VVNEICKHLSVINRIFVCSIDRRKNPERYNTARCMMDDHAAAYIDCKYCDSYTKKKEEENGQS
jgi:hypothetical protein